MAGLGTTSNQSTRHVSCSKGTELLFHTYRLFALSAKTVATLETGDFKLVSVIDKAIRTLQRKGKEGENALRSGDV